MNQEPPLPYKEDKFNFWQFLHWVAAVPCFAFIWHIVGLIREYGEDEALEIFRSLRDRIFVGFVVVFVVLGLVILILGRESKLGRQGVQRLLPILATALILVTFSFEIASFVRDILSLFGFW